ncbi:IclR family transcriptional regulator [Acidobacteriota bacterium]
MNKESNGNYSKTFRKGLRILDLFNQDHSGLKLKEIAAELSLDMMTAYRLVNTLVIEGYLVKEPETKLLKLGSKAISLGYRAINTLELMKISQPLLDEAHEVYKVSVQLGILDGNRVLMLYEKHTRDTLVFLGPRVITALHCSALGKAILAHLPEETQSTIIDSLDFTQRTNNSIPSIEVLFADLKNTKEKGFALNNEEWTPGLLVIGAPIVSTARNEVLGGVIFAFSTFQYTMEEVEKKYGQKIIGLAKKISEKIP